MSLVYENSLDLDYTVRDYAPQFANGLFSMVTEIQSLKFDDKLDIYQAHQEFIRKLEIVIDTNDNNYVFTTPLSDFRNILKELACLIDEDYVENLLNDMVENIISNKRSRRGEYKNYGAMLRELNEIYKDYVLQHRNY